MTVIGVDCDGVLADHIGILYKYVRNTYGENVVEQLDGKYDEGIPEIEKTKREVYRESRKNIQKYHLKMSPIPGSITAMNKLHRDDSLTLNVVTHRDSATRDQTVEWLEKYNIPYDNLFQQAPKDKAETGITVHIDDRAHILEDSSAQTKVLFKRDYNSEDWDKFYTVSETKPESQWSQIAKKLTV